MDQNNQTQAEYELKLRYAEAARVLDWHRRNVEKRLAKDVMTIESLVRVLQEPRGAAKAHAASFRDYIRQIVRQELGGAQ